jgi:ABC-type amino acid transport substrate-binding protein
MRSIGAASVAVAVALACGVGAALADDAAAKKELAPAGKLRVGIAVAPTPGAGNVAPNAGGGYRGVAVDLGEELAGKLGVPAEFVPYPNSGALTDAAESGAWDVAFLPVDAQRKARWTSARPTSCSRARTWWRPDRRSLHWPTLTRLVCAWRAWRTRLPLAPRRPRSKRSP